ncbi:MULTISPECIES: GNAT family N-acetyltransferase [Butyricimonas]|uniref:GNAT family N-acetyltransferase n=1 Tax=Butyricimonas TaxID=574697 RepID=UPI001E34CC4B|nr:MULTISPECIES: GNAT family N-acetyltransferase [Butyricimonas]
MTMNITFEKLGNKHQKEVMDIFNYYVENSFAAFAEHRLPDIFFEKILEKIQDYPAYAIKESDSGATAGFCYLSPYHPLPTFRHTAQISYFILPHYTHAGAGKMCLDLLEADAKKRGIRIILADISSKKPQSISFHEKFGFTPCARLEKVGHKFGEDFDVIIMQKNL